MTAATSTTTARPATSSLMILRSKILMRLSVKQGRDVCAVRGRQGAVNMVYRAHGRDIQVLAKDELSRLTARTRNTSKMAAHSGLVAIRSGAEPRGCAEVRSSVSFSNVCRIVVISSRTSANCCVGHECPEQPLQTGPPRQLSHASATLRDSFPTFSHHIDFFVSVGSRLSVRQALTHSAKI